MQAAETFIESVVPIPNPSHNHIVKKDLPQEGFMYTHSTFDAMKMTFDNNQMYDAKCFEIFEKTKGLGLNFKDKDTDVQVLVSWRRVVDLGCFYLLMAFIALYVRNAPLKLSTLSNPLCFRTL